MSKYLPTCLGFVGKCSKAGLRRSWVPQDKAKTTTAPNAQARQEIAKTGDRKLNSRMDGTEDVQPN